MFKNYIIVIGGSAGAITALDNLLSPLPADFPATILIVVHIPPTPISRLPQVISHFTKIPVVNPFNGLPLESNRIYVAPSNVHMIIENDTIYLKHSPKINKCRPAIDPLFLSAAYHHENRVIGILLSGLLNDGSAGLKEIKEHKGITIIQSLEEAEYPDMPKNAAQNTTIDHCLPTHDIASLLIKYINNPLPPLNSNK
ncbi:TPA: chemotaxis protein CheB [Legionella bozemanae]|uniref:chemotaxis protein CheB n=1 Tax=Legionella bozemanae TaxID=447 RepID=UPI0010413D20|nr:chemotaxis protein CheB [Legionella bozemanae]